MHSYTFYTSPACNDTRPNGPSSIMVINPSGPIERRYVGTLFFDVLLRQTKKIGRIRTCSLWIWTYLANFWRHIRPYAH